MLMKNMHNVDFNFYTNSEPIKNIKVEYMSVIFVTFIIYELKNISSSISHTKFMNIFVYLILTRSSYT